MVVAVTAYGMATFEGPMLSLKSVSAISHYTDWIIAHVHIGALGWNGFLTFGILYWLIPRIFRTKLYSKKLASQSFLAGHTWNRFLCGSVILGRFYAKQYVETIY